MVMSFLVDNLSKANVMLFLIIVLLIFIAITIVYIIHLQTESNNITRKGLNKNVPIYKDSPVSEDKKDDSLDLQSLTKELETIPRERVVHMTPYEEEQEEKAIISYDELVRNNRSREIQYSDSLDGKDISVKQVDLENTTKLNLQSIKEENDRVVNLLDYTHEEEFLKELKDLNKIIN